MKMPTHIVAAGSFTEDGKGNLLMVKTHNSGWVFPGGQVEEGESLTEGVIREVKEESGIDIIVKNLAVVTSNTGGYFNKHEVYIPTKVMFDFICEPVGGKLDISDETTESGWFPIDTIMGMLTKEAYKERFKAYLEYSGRVKYLVYKTKPEYVLKDKRSI